ncbi:hypothetical protein RIF29_42376 [Crotalaria pallida]|uniref:GOLD domain-containing protein n=1 Tax=Crotalaria pallida TaxID=3830 RepID=A0AAN9E9Q4_CROPI
MLLSPCSVAVTFLLPNDGTKCISEELHSNVVVLTDYAIHTTDEDHYPSVFLSVSGPYGNDFLSLRSVSHGNFSFTTQEAGNYMACFWVNDHYPVPGELTLTIDWKIGIAAKDWDSIAKKEKIEGVELELRKLEEVVEDIHGNLLHLKYNFAIVAFEAILQEEEAYLDLLELSEFYR